MDSPDEKAVAAARRLLVASLDRRWRVEEVAAVAGALSDLGDAGRAALRGVATPLSALRVRLRGQAFAGGNAGVAHARSSMSDDFARPVGLGRQVRVGRDLFPSVKAPGDADDPAAVRAYVAAVADALRTDVTRTDFLRDRLNRESRAAAGIDLSKRQYNKRFRLLRRMNRKRATLEAITRLRRAAQLSKGRLAHRLTADDLADDRSLAFVAYVTAKANRRSLFTAGSQERAYDAVAASLLDDCFARPGRADWLAIAHAHPVPRVLDRLDDEGRGRLLGLWTAGLRDLASVMAAVWDRNSFRRDTMVVKRGDDSTTWNLLAGAWNKARDGWLNVLYAMGLDAVIETACPGKAMRLMAADVTAWHRMTGGKTHGDTLVWSRLPLPWKVLDGTAKCPRFAVVSACEAAGVDPLKSGWVLPRPEAQPRPFRPTPELVHGVQVADAGTAALLRRIGAFSGKHASGYAAGVAGVAQW